MSEPESNEKKAFSENFEKGGETLGIGECKSRMSFESVAGISAAKEYTPERGLKSIDSKQGEGWSFISANNGSENPARIRNVRDADNFTWH
jgi:hypothetical protein